MTQRQAEFHIGQLIHHRRLHYRGVVVDVDPVFQGSDAWYEQVARSRPPKNSPWYRVLVRGEQHETYIAERNLEPDRSAIPVEHPRLTDLFSDFQGGRYRPLTRTN